MPHFRNFTKTFMNLISFIKAGTWLAVSARLWDGWRCYRVCVVAASCSPTSAASPPCRTSAPPRSWCACSTSSSPGQSPHTSRTPLMLTIGLVCRTYTRYIVQLLLLKGLPITKVVNKGCRQSKISTGIMSSKDQPLKYPTKKNVSSPESYTLIFIDISEWRLTSRWFDYKLIENIPSSFFFVRIRCTLNIFNNLISTSIIIVRVRDDGWIDV